jgi:hypothetical protein
MFEFHDDEYEMRVLFDEDQSEYVVLYLIGGEEVNVGRGDTVLKALGELYRQMQRDIELMLIEHTNR